LIGRNGAYPRQKNSDPQTVTLTAEAIEILRLWQDIGSVWVFPETGAIGHIV
jgi:hypothetical protein